MSTSAKLDGEGETALGRQCRQINSRLGRFSLPPAHSFPISVSSSSVHAAASAWSSPPPVMVSWGEESSDYQSSDSSDDAEQDYYYSQQQQPPFRRVVSTGDVGALSPEPAVAVRYSTEERRERIEKYRSKRNQRNFQKKITYACRKTLADSRPRVKGRFARNIDDMTEQTDFTAAEVSSMMNKSSDIIAPADASSNSMPDWWPAMQGALTMEEDELYVAVSSINLY